MKFEYFLLVMTLVALSTFSTCAAAGTITIDFAGIKSPCARIAERRREKS